MTPLRLLKKFGWIQNHSFRTKNNQSIVYLPERRKQLASGNCIGMCLTGAINTLDWQSILDKEKYEQKVINAIKNILLPLGIYPEIISYNDYPGRTFAEVEALLTPIENEMWGTND